MFNNLGRYNKDELLLRWFGRGFKIAERSSIEVPLYDLYINTTEEFVDSYELLDKETNYECVETYIGKHHIIV